MSTRYSHQPCLPPPHRAKGSPGKRLGAGVDLRVPRPPPSALRACRVRRVQVGCAARCARSVGHAGLAPRPVDQRLAASDEAAGGLHRRGLCCTSSAHGHRLPHASRRGLLPRRRLHRVRWGGRAGAHRIAHASPATAAGPLPRLHCSACSRDRLALRSWASYSSCSWAARPPPSPWSSQSPLPPPLSRAASRSHCPRPARARRSSSRPARPAVAAPASSTRRCRPGPRCSVAPSPALRRSTWA
jgi:hypothetical protein